MDAILVGRLNGCLALCYKEIKVASNLRQRLQSVLDQLTPGSPARQSYSDESCNVHYIISSGVVYMLAASKSVSVTLAMNFLQNLAGLFSIRFSPNAISVAVGEAPFASFAPEIEKLVRDTEVRSAMAQLHAETQDIKDQIQQSVDEIINRGNKLSDIEIRADELLTRAKDVMGDAKQLNREALWRQYSLFIIIGGIVLALVLIRAVFR